MHGFIFLNQSSTNPVWICCGFELQEVTGGILWLSLFGELGFLFLFPFIFSVMPWVGLAVCTNVLRKQTAHLPASFLGLALQLRAGHLPCVVWAECPVVGIHTPQILSRSTCYPGRNLWQFFTCCMVISTHTPYIQFDTCHSPNSLPTC